MRCLVGFWMLVAASPAFAAAPIGYATATGYFKKDSRPTLYQPLNLLDARENTAWCTSNADPLNDHLVFGFQGVAQIDEVRIYTGNGFDESTFKEFGRAHKFLLKSPNRQSAFTVSDQRGLQAVILNPPLRGSRFVLEISDVFPAEDPDTPTCITDVVFYSRGRALNGSWLVPKLKYDRARQSVMGTWFAGYAGAPDHFLSFFFDGTYRYNYEPFDKTDAKPKTFEGRYDVSTGRLSFELPNGEQVNARVRRETADVNGRSSTRLTFEGPLPAELKQTYRDAM